MILPRPLCLEDRAAPVRRWGVVIPLVLAAPLAGCISPKIEICNVKEACAISAPASVQPIQIPALP